MDRKNFIRTSTAILAASCLPKPGEANSQATDPDKKFIIPPYLTKGDVIGITSPAGYIKYPVCFHFPVGHQRNNYALKCGVEHRLVVNSSNCTLTEI